MRHLPNLLTLGNLLCGCIAIVCVLTAQPYLMDANPSEPGIMWSWAYGSPQLFLGGVLIFAAGLFDALDGFAARALGVHSPIGADLDSLADVVSFGVAPSAIMYRLLWDATAAEPLVTDVDMLLLLPAFAIALFAALRLARFNVFSTSSSEFRGLPSPATGLFVASLALLNWDKPGMLDAFFHQRWTLYIIIALLCWLMVSRIRFVKLLPSGKWTPRAALPLLVVAAGTAISFVFFSYAAVAIGLLLYILVSLLLPERSEPAKAGVPLN